MKRKIVILDEDLLPFAIQRCEADEKLGKAGVNLAVGTGNLAGGKKMADYVVMVMRLRAALEAARDES